jgi:GTP-binding protein
MPAEPPGTAPVVAVVGRPNAGKSTLVNRLCRRRVAIVADEPGMTRDRVYAQTTLRDRPVVLVDTGGFDVDRASPVVQAIRDQLLLAVEEADVVVCLFDGAAPPTSLDEEVVERLRRAGREVVWAANKTEGKKARQVALEYHELGVDELLYVSAAQGEGVGELVDAVVERLPAEPEPAAAPPPPDAVRLAIMGRPNAGKSTLVNTLLGEARMIVDEAPGTTRDAVQHTVTFHGEPWVLIDTAGMRRRRSIDRMTEELSVLHAVKAMGLAEVVLMLVDVTADVAEQDLRIANLALRRGRGLVVGLNKWDAAGEKPERLELVRPYSPVGTMEFVPVVRLSGREGWNLDELFDTARRVARNRRRRISTPQLNRFLEAAVEDHQPPAFRHRPVTLKYAAQVADAPPTIAVFTNRPEGVSDTYRRYLENRLRDTWDFTGVPLRIVFRKKAARDRRPDRRGGR